MKSANAGDGLPEFERGFIEHVLVPCVRIFLSWNSSLFLIKRELKTIQNLVEQLPVESLQKQVVIDRVFAIEEHTRDFSVNMVLEHLTIAGSAVMNVIQTLSAEKSFDHEIKIENVKPKDNSTTEHLKFYEFMNRYIKYIEEHPRNNSKMTKAHPWFVAFNNKDWASFMFMHTFIHRRQIEAIIKKL